MAHVLVAARLAEDHLPAQEAQLHALLSLMEVGELPRDAVEPLRALSLPTDDAGQADYLRELFD